MLRPELCAENRIIANNKSPSPMPPSGTLWKGDKHCDKKLKADS
jgi:hypothetical protein